jgi:hypothetical protein
MDKFLQISFHKVKMILFQNTDIILLYYKYFISIRSDIIKGIFIYLISIKDFISNLDYPILSGFNQSNPKLNSSE